MRRRGTTSGPAVSKLILRRLLDLAGVLLGVSVLVFLMIRLIPGDAAQVMLGASGDASEAQVQQLREKLGLNDPVPVQYLRWVGAMAQGDFGVSIWTGKPVMEDIAQRIGVTAELTFLSLVLAVLFSVPAGALMAYFRGSVSDVVMRFITITGVTMPAFWLGALLIFGWAIWFPNWQTLGSIPPMSEDPWSHLQRMVLPTLTCALPVIASLARIMRSAMIDALGQDYIRTARSKGLGEWTVVVKHALRNSLIPYVTALGIMAGVDPADPVIGHGPGVIGRIAHRQQAAVDQRMQGLDPAIHHLGKPGDLRNVLHRQPGCGDRGAGAARGDQFNPHRRQGLGRLQQSGLVGDGDQRPLHGGAVGGLGEIRRGGHGILLQIKEDMPRRAASMTLALPGGRPPSSPVTQGRGGCRRRGWTRQCGAQAPASAIASFHRTLAPASCRAWPRNTTCWLWRARPS